MIDTQKPKTTNIIRQSAQEMRRNPTKAEAHLLQVLRKRQLGFFFRRQHPIGHYIVDFCCTKLKLIIEVDGEIHNKRQEIDQVRTEWLDTHGYQVIRFSNEDVLYDTNAVRYKILLACLSVENEHNSNLHTRLPSTPSEPLVRPIGGGWRGTAFRDGWGTRAKWLLW